MLIYIDLSVLSATRNYDLEGKDSHCGHGRGQPRRPGCRRNDLRARASEEEHQGQGYSLRWRFQGPLHASREDLQRNGKFDFKQKWSTLLTGNLTSL